MRRRRRVAAGRPSDMRGPAGAGSRRSTARRRWASSWLGERGSVAVEFALLLPLLLLVVCGIIDFGRALNAQITLTQAAREGVRLESVGTASATIVTDTEQAATGLGLGSSNVCVGGASPGTSCAGAAGTYLCTSSSSTTSTAEVTVAYTFSFITPVGYLADWFSHGTFNNSVTLSATGVEPCET